jgi:hypothetical protein
VHLLLLYLSLCSSAKAIAIPKNTSLCSIDHIQQPTIYGAQITSFQVSEVDNYSITGAETPGSQVVLNYTNLSFCNVSIQYTHPGWNDSIHVQIWLPPLARWNGRFQGTGGGGWITGDFDSALAPAIAQGFAAGSTDGGHSSTAPVSSWGLMSPGNVNLTCLKILPPWL